MDLHYKREVTVGTLVVAGFVAFVVGSMWLKGKDFKAGEHTRIVFHEVGNLKVASPVAVAGVQVGKVQSIQLVDRDHVIVAISLPANIQPKTDASAQIVSLSLTGDVGIDFDPGRSGTPLAKGQVVQGSQAPGFGDIAANLSARADTVLRGVQQLVDTQMVRQLRATSAAAQATLAAAQRTMQLYGDPDRGPTAELTKTMQQFRQLGLRLDSTLASPGLQRALQRSDSLTQSLNAMSAQFAVTGARLDSVLAQVQHGDGTLGRLASDSTLYHNIVRLTASLDTLMQDLKKHPEKIQLTVPVKLF
jgi:phospholipid/cholesterol/gamma-HCH transport system substrate-binding protein